MEDEYILQLCISRFQCMNQPNQAKPKEAKPSQTNQPIIIIIADDTRDDDDNENFTNPTLPKENFLSSTFGLPFQ